MFSSLFPCPLGCQGSVRRAEEGLQAKNTCLVIFPRDKIEVHQPVGVTDLLAFFEDGCNMWLSLILSVDLYPWLLWQAQGWLPSFKHTEQLPAPAVTPVHFMHCRAGQQFSCRVAGGVQQSLPAKGRDAEEKGASLLYWQGQVARQWVGEMLS